MPSNNKYILVADDEASYREILLHQLTEAGYSVVLAADGDAAVALLSQQQFALALLDIKMPKLDGIQVLTYISKNCPQTKAIMLTGFADLELAMEAKELGAVDFIDKPFSLDDLLASVRQAIS